MRSGKGPLLRISIEIETTKKSLFYLLAQSVSVYPTSNVGTLVTLYINPRRRHDSYYSRDRDTTRQAFARRWRACWRGSWGLAPASVASVSRAAKSVSAR